MLRLLIPSAYGGCGTASVMQRKELKVLCEAHEDLLDVLADLLINTCFESNHNGTMGFPGDTGGEELTCQRRRHKRCKSVGLMPGLGRSPGGGQGSPLQYSCLENPTDRGAWRATAHGVTRLRQLGTRAQRCYIQNRIMIGGDVSCLRPCCSPAFGPSAK